MKESYREGVANHPGPESCGGRREVTVEALTGVRIGRVLSREITQILVPTRSTTSEGNTAGRAVASAQGARRGRRPLACAETPYAEPGRSRVRLAKMGAGTRGEGIAGRPR